MPKRIVPLQMWISLHITGHGNVKVSFELWFKCPWDLPLSPIGPTRGYSLWIEGEVSLGIFLFHGRILTVCSILLSQWGNRVTWQQRIYISFGLKRFSPKEETQWCVWQYFISGNLLVKCKVFLLSFLLGRIRLSESSQYCSWSCSSWTSTPLSCSRKNTFS